MNKVCLNKIPICRNSCRFDVRAIILEVSTGKRTFGKRRRKIRGVDRERVERSGT